MNKNGGGDSGSSEVVVTACGGGVDGSEVHMARNRCAFKKDETLRTMMFSGEVFTREHVFRDVLCA
ncbi:hypothetical protein BVC80_8325g9 [Macleaya cordata]|uniref:Uncharacterized protein n=1 Tax=Macleaya cordata TaxID=56857 RepID=A0A200PZ79_MACCD|nr:hypothetical protein BVC80_8325g9 [Macleaya cordata]